MTILKQEDLVSSIADALQFISYYHPKDYLQHLARAYEREQSPAAGSHVAAGTRITRQFGFARQHRFFCQHFLFSVAHRVYP